MTRAICRRRCRKAGLALVPALAALAVPALAAPRWVPISPDGVALGAIVRAAPPSATAFAASPGRGLYRSDDDGRSWRALPPSPMSRSIRELRADPADAATLYALAPEGASRSRDGGESWTAIDGGFDGGRALALTPAPHTAGGLYAATTSGLLRSADRGDHWARIAFAARAVLAVAVDPGDESTLLAVLSEVDDDHEPTLLRSTDGGASWADRAIAPLGIANTEPRFVDDAARPGTVYLFFRRFSEFGQPGPLLRSTDRGATWQGPFPADPLPVEVSDLASSPDGTLYATFGLGVLTSGDRGETWIALGGPPATRRPRDLIVRLATSLTAPGTVLATGTLGAWRTVDRGAHFRAANRGLALDQAVGVGVPPLGARKVLAVAGGRVFESRDRGARWQSIHSAFDADEPTVLVFDPQNPRRIYGLGDDGQASLFLKSDDAGHTWTRPEFPYTCGGDSICSVGFGAFAVDPSDSDTLYVAGSYFFHFGGRGDFFLRSRDGGATWKGLPLVRATALAVDPRRSSVLYALTGRRLVKSEDGARTWRVTGRSLPRRGLRSIAIDPTDPERLYVGTAHGVSASLDGGTTFAPMNAGIETKHIDTILVDPLHPDRLYATGFAQGIFRWLPTEHRWQALDDGLPPQDFTISIALDPRPPATLYAAVDKGGVYRLDLEPTGGTVAEPSEP